MNIWYIILFNIILSLILCYTKDKKKTKILRIIQIALFIIVVYFVTDTFIDFFIIMCCYSVMFVLLIVMNSEWIKSKLFFRCMLALIGPIVIVLVVFNTSQFILFNPVIVFQTLIFIALPFKNKKQKWNKVMYIETAFLVLGCIVGFIIMEYGYSGEPYNKPQKYAVDYIVDEVGISSNEIERVCKDEGIRGEEIKVVIKTKYETYIVVYKGSKIIDIIQ